MYKLQGQEYNSWPSGKDIRIGGDQEGNAYWFDGKIDEVRVSTTARYTDDYSTPTDEFETDSDTMLLFHLNEGPGESTRDFSNGEIGEIANPDWIGPDPSTSDPAF